jgi:two-component system response regulator MprA
MTAVLIVDDDQRLLRMLRRTLTYEGLDVVTAANGQEGLDQVQAHRPEVIVLDWLMPEMDGIEMVKVLRNEDNRTMVLMLTARDAIESRVEGLESGADDYLVKPFAPQELVARVRALLRRSEAAREKEALSYADLTLDPLTREVRRGDEAFELTPTEFDLLHFLMRHPRQVLHREQILSSVWGYDFYGDDNVIEVYIGYLRRKIEAGGKPRLIHTVRGVGYVVREK